MIELAAAAAARKVVVHTRKCVLVSLPSSLKGAVVVGDKTLVWRAAGVGVVSVGTSSPVCPSF